MLTKKHVEPHWITRGGKGPFADEVYAIIPELPPGYLATKIFYLPLTIPNYAEQHTITYNRILDLVRRAIAAGRYNNPPLFEDLMRMET